MRKPTARVATLEAPTGLYSLARVLPSGRSLLLGFGLILGALFTCTLILHAFAF